MSRKDKYPEHEKVKAIQDQSQTIGGFLDWLQNEREERIVLCYPTSTYDFPYVPARVGIEQLLAEYFNIDYKKFGEEKDEMVRELQAAARKSS